VSAQETQEKQKENELFKHFLDAFLVQVNDANDKDTFIESLEAVHMTLFEVDPNSNPDSAAVAAADRANKFIEWISDELNTLSDQVQNGRSKDEIDDDIARIVDNIESYSPGAGAIYGAALKKFAYVKNKSTLNTDSQNPGGGEASAFSQGSVGDTDAAAQERARKRRAAEAEMAAALAGSASAVEARSAGAPVGKPATQESGQASGGSPEDAANNEFVEREKTKLTNLEKGLLYKLAQINVRSTDESVKATNERFLKSIKTNLEAQREVYKNLNGAGAVSAQDIQSVDAALRVLEQNFSPDDLETTIFGGFVAKHPDYYAEQKAANQPERGAEKPGDNPEAPPPNAEAVPTPAEFLNTIGRTLQGYIGSNNANVEVFIGEIRQQFDSAYKSNLTAENAVRSERLVTSLSRELLALKKKYGSLKPDEVVSAIDAASQKLSREYPDGASLYFSIFNHFFDRNGAPKKNDSSKKEGEAESGAGSPEQVPSFDGFASTFDEILNAAENKQAFIDALGNKVLELFKNTQSSEAAQKALVFVQTLYEDIRTIGEFARDNAATDQLEVGKKIDAAVARAEKEYPGLGEFYHRAINRFIGEFLQGNSRPPETPPDDEHVPKPFVYVKPPNLTLETSAALLQKFDGLSSLQDKKIFILEDHPGFVDAWMADKGRAASIEGGDDAGDERFVEAFRAYILVPHIIEGYNKLVADELTSPLFKGMDLGADVETALGEMIGRDPEGVRKLAEQLEAYQSTLKNIDVLEGKLEQLGGLDAAEEEADKIREQIDLYEAAEQAGFLTPLKAYTKAVAYGVRDLWNKAWGKTPRKWPIIKKSSELGWFQKQAPDRYDKLVSLAESAARQLPEVQELQELVTNAVKAGNAEQEAILNAQLTKLFAERFSGEMVRIWNEDAGKSNEQIDEQIAERRERERVDWKRMEARDKVINENRFNDVEVNILNPLEVFGIFGRERRPMGNPYRPEMRAQLAKLRQQIEANGTKIEQIQNTEDLAESASEITSFVRNTVLQTLGGEDVIRKKAIGVLNSVMKDDFVANLQAYSEVKKLADEDDDDQTIEGLNTIAQQKLDSFADMKGKFAQSIREVLDKNLTAASSQGLLAKLRTGLLEPLKKNGDKAAVKTVSTIVASILESMRKQKELEKDTAKSKEMSLKITYLDAFSKDLSSLAKT
jgi:hypothetical protein